MDVNLLRAKVNGFTWYSLFIGNEHTALALDCYCIVRWWKIAIAFCCWCFVVATSHVFLWLSKALKRWMKRQSDNNTERENVIHATICSGELHLGLFCIRVYVCVWGVQVYLCAEHWSHQIHIVSARCTGCTMYNAEWANRIDIFIPDKSKFIENGLVLEKNIHWFWSIGWLNCMERVEWLQSICTHSMLVGEIHPISMYLASQFQSWIWNTYRRIAAVFTIIYLHCIMRKYTFDWIDRTLIYFPSWIVSSQPDNQHKITHLFSVVRFDAFADAYGRKRDLAVPRATFYCSKLFAIGT